MVEKKFHSLIDYTLKELLTVNPSVERAKLAHYLVDLVKNLKKKASKHPKIAYDVSVEEAIDFLLATKEQGVDNLKDQVSSEAELREQTGKILQDYVRRVESDNLSLEQLLRLDLDGVLRRYFLDFGSSSKPNSFEQ